MVLGTYVGPYSSVVDSYYPMHFEGIISTSFCFHDAGDAQIGPQVTPLDPTTVASEVYYGTQSGNYTSFATGTAIIYNQIYPYQGLLNYTSGIIHHVRLEGWSPSLSHEL